MGIGFEVSFPLAFLAGIISFLSPCTLPILPSFLAYLSGTSQEDHAQAQTVSRGQMMLSALFFVVGFTLVFIILGASISALGKLLFAYQTTLIKASGILLILFGIFLTGWVKIPFLYREFKLLELKSKPAGYAGALAVGFTFGVGWTPCIGPILGAILTIAGTSQGVQQGMLLLAVYSMGLAIPFLLSAWLFHSLLEFIQKYKKIMRAVHVGGGLVLASMGVLLVTGYFQYLNNYTATLAPDWIVQWL